MNPPSVAERILLAATTVFLVVAPFTSSAGWRAATLITAMACLVYLLATQRLTLPRSLPIALLATLGAWCALSIASLAWTTNRTESLHELRGQLLYSAFAFTAFFVASNTARWRIWWKTMLGGTLLLIGLEAMRAHLEPRFGMRPWDGGDGALSTHLVLMAPLLFPLAWAERDDQPERLVLFGAALSLLFAAAWDTENRIVWFSFLVSFATAALALRFASHVRPRVRGVRYIALAAVAVILTLAALMAGYRSWVDPSVHSGGLVGMEIDVRPRLWRLALDEIARAPWLGHGFGRQIAEATFHPVHPHPFLDPEFQHAHNLFLNVALQLGLAGLALFVAILVLLAREFILALRERETCPAAVIGLSVLTGFVTKNLTDDFLYRHNGLVFWALMGMLLGLIHRARR